MQVIKHFKAFFTIWEPSVARKITFYFTLFGLMIFYLTSVVHMIGSQKRLATAATRLVQHQLAKIPGSHQSRYWLKMIDQKQSELRDLAELLLTLTDTAHTITDVSIYTQTGSGRLWQRLRLDDDDHLRAAPADEDMIQKLDLHKGDFVGSPGSDLFMSPKNIALFVRLSDPREEGIVFIRIDVLRQGISKLFLDWWLQVIAVVIIVFLVIRVIAYMFAHALAKPVEQISEAAEKVAKGDLSTELPDMGKTELGALGINFNKMIQGLREWQKIKEIEMELEKGRAIQQDFLPTHIPCPPNWDIATSFFPAREVSGDFYDVFDLPGGSLGLVIADVCDKGVGSALYMALIRSLIRVYAEQKLNPATEENTAPQLPVVSTNSIQPERGLTAVRLTSNYLARHHGREGMFATLFFGILEPNTGKLVYVNGGHEPLYLIGRNGLKSELLPTGPAVGIMEDAHYKSDMLQLKPGDLLLGLTDGVTEARSPSDELFTRQRVKQLFTRPVKSAGELLEEIRRQVFDFAGTTPETDDVTMLAVKRLR